MKWNRKKIEADAAEAREGRGGAWIGLKDGEKAEWRPLPVEKPAREDDEVELALRHGQHYLKHIGVYLVCLNEPVVADYLPEAWGSRPCEPCKKWAEYRSSRNPDDQEEAKKYSNSLKYLGNVALPSGEVKIHRYNSNSYPLLVGLMSGQYEDVFEIKNGRNVEVKCTSDRGDYTITPMKETSSLRSDILDDLHDLYAAIAILEPAKQRAMLKSGAKPADDEFVTLRDLMNLKAGAGKKPGADVKADKDVKADRGAGGVKADASGAAVNGSRPATRRELKLLNAFAEELGMVAKDEELDDEKPYDELVETIVTEAVDSKTKGLSEDLLAWLSANGCAVDGRVVTRAPATAAVAAAEEEEMTEIEKQIAKVREQSKARKK